MDKTSAAYKKAVRQANLEYGPGSSIYRSGRIVTLYKQLGGVLAEKPKSSRRGLSRWFREAWVQVIPYLERGQVVACGAERTRQQQLAAGGPGKACRPLHRISKATPITIAELLQLHSKRAIVAAARAKERSPTSRVLWKMLTVRPATRGS